MKTAITILIIGLASIHILPAQEIIQWSPDVQITLEDYKASTTEINEGLNMFSINSGIQLDFAYSMTAGEFMFTKNFNTKAKATFDQSLSSVMAPNKEIANELVRFGQLNFDLCELAARKLRKRLYEEKGAFTNANFFQPIYDEIMKDMLKRHNELAKATDLGRNEELTKVERAKILEEISQYPNFCFDCKPPKQKKKKR